MKPTYKEIAKATAFLAPLDQDRYLWHIVAT